MATAEQAHENWGGRDEAGYVRGLKKKGMTIASSGSELLDNSSDAGANNFRPTIAYEDVYFGDNGAGMDQNNLKNAFIMEHENNRDRYTKGVAGIGLKVALAFLSDWKYPCVILTKKSKGKYLKVEIPWDRIFEELKWDKMISPATEMTSAEILEFEKYLPSENKEHGTVIKIKKTFKVCEHIRNQFNDERKKLSKIDRWDIQIQSPFIQISLCDFDDNPNTFQNLEPYKIFCDNEPVYMGYTTNAPIDLYRHKYTGEYEWTFKEEEDEDEKFFGKYGKGISKTPSKWDKKMAEKTFEKIDNISSAYKAHTPINKNWFDPEKPLEHSIYGSSSANFMLALDRNKKFFNNNGGDEEIDFYKTVVEKNGRVYGQFEVPEYKIKGGYGGTQQHNLKNVYTKCTRDIFTYKSLSNQDNELDYLMGVQQKKSSWDPSCILENIKLSRILTYLKKRHGEKILEWVNKIIKHAEAESSVKQEDEESESEQEDEESESEQEDEESESEQNDEESESEQEDEESESEQEDEEKNGLQQISIDYNSDDEQRDVIQSSDNKITQDVENKPQSFDRFIENDENKVIVFNLLTREGNFIETDEKKIKVFDLLRREGLI